jgi:uncharacterized membrane protein YccC
MAAGTPPGYLVDLSPDMAKPRHCQPMTCVVLILLSPALGGLRMLEKVVGAAVGMLATFGLWPSWEAHFLRHRLAEDLRGNRRFLLAVLDAWPGTATVREADTARRQAGLTGNNAEASLRRALEEPRRDPRSDRCRNGDYRRREAACRRSRAHRELEAVASPAPEAHDP